MGANGPNMDRWSPAIWRNHVETVAEMHQLGWKVKSVCETCELPMWVDLGALTKLRGPDFSLWNAAPKCRRIGCAGRVRFEAKPPGIVAFNLRATGPARPARMRRGATWV